MADVPHSPRAEAEAEAASDDIATLEGSLEEQEKNLKDLYTRESAEGGGRSASDQLADARKRRDAARKTVQATQARLSALQGERREKVKKLDKLMLKQSSKAPVVNPEQALPSVAMRGGGDTEVVKDIEALLRENKELEESLMHFDGTRLHLEKLQNEKRNTARRVKELKGEEKVMREQLEIKKAELAELQEQVKPSPVRARYEADVARLRKEINAHTQARTHAERESAVHSKRLLRVRAVLGGFLKAEGLKAQDKLPAMDDELAARLADHVVGLADKVHTLERAMGAREERAAALQQSSAEASEELKRLVTRRGKEQRKVAPTGFLTGDAAGPSADAAAEPWGSSAEPPAALRPQRAPPKRPPPNAKKSKARPAPDDADLAPEWSSPPRDGPTAGGAVAAAEAGKDYESYKEEEQAGSSTAD